MGRRAAAAAISAVLDNDDLLGEILLPLAFPTSLVRAVLVCKRWLRLASAPAFLHHFRDLHPPHILRFDVVTAGTRAPRFLPLPPWRPRPRELGCGPCFVGNLDEMTPATQSLFYSCGNLDMKSEKIFSWEID